MKALVWFCVQEVIFSKFSFASSEEDETIKIILGKIKDGKQNYDKR